MISTSSIAYNGIKKHSLTFSAVQVVMGSLLIALCAQISIPLPFTLVPVSMQTFAVMMVGAMLGSRKGAAAVILYLVESIVGLPVLAGGHVNPLALIGPCGGYLIGFVAQAYLVGWFAERAHVFGKLWTAFGVSLACALQLALGAFWLAQFVGYEAILVMGVLPFIPGEMIKILAVVNSLSRHDTSAN
jgi:biotin transport system substrate-specific component